jgi:hypothetical protein
VPAIEPIIVKVVQTPPTPELGFGAILAQALGLTGLTLIASLLMGLLLGAVFIWMRTRRPLNAFNGAGSEQVRLHLTPDVR